jgi:hypothetical protein
MSAKVPRSTSEYEKFTASPSNRGGTVLEVSRPIRKVLAAETEKWATVVKSPTPSGIDPQRAR